MNKLSINEENAISKLLDRTQELIELEKLDDAERFLHEVSKYKPDEPNVFFQRGLISMKRGEYDDAIEKFMSVYETHPEFFENLNNIATAYYKLGRYRDALIYYKRALQIEPDTSFILGSAAFCSIRMGNIDDALHYLRTAQEILPNDASIHSDLLLCMIYTASVFPEQLYEEAVKFGNILTSSSHRVELNPDKNRDRKIRVGYVSPDFRDHPVRYFLEPLLTNHNKEYFEIYAYSNTKLDNPIMERMKTYVDFWRDIRDLSVADACNIIVHDQIDILVDLTGHTAGNSLEIFARKPAAVQVTWLGFPATTGLQTMDYRITDGYADPPGMTEHLYTEKLWRLPHIFCSYQPDEKDYQKVEMAPFETNGYITFGCLNNFAKAGDNVLSSWAEILKKVPNSRLILEIEGIDGSEFCKDYQERLEKSGISKESVILEPRKKSNQFILYNKIDIALDPFPCVGGTTTMDTLWMGVPLVTLAGKNFGARMGVSILSNIGLTELIADDIDSYIKIAVDLAKNRERLKETRKKICNDFCKSPAMNHQNFAREMEEAYTAMWKKYCDFKD